MSPRQLLKNQKSKTMKRLKNCPGKQSNLAKPCRTNKSVAALKKEISCLKRNYSVLKLQLQEQKLEYATLNRKYVLLETEVEQLQISNATLKEENRQYEKLVSNTEPEIRACMTRMVETSQTLAGLQMAFNRHRSRQQLSKISGSMSKNHPTMGKNSVKHSKNVLNVAPRRKQAVRPMVQGLQIFTNLTIPLQRISLPNQATRRVPVPVVEAPQESEAVDIAAEPERPNPLSFEKHRRNLHFVKNIKSKPKHFVKGSKKDDCRHPKGDFKHSGSICMVPQLNFDDSSDSEPEPKVKRFMKPIVLIRDFKAPSVKSGKCNATDSTQAAKTSLNSFQSGQVDSNSLDPLEGTSKMYLSNSHIGPKRRIHPAFRRNSSISDSDSDSESPVKKSELPTPPKRELCPPKVNLKSATGNDEIRSQHVDNICTTLPTVTVNLSNSSAPISNVAKTNSGESFVSETQESGLAEQDASDDGNEDQIPDDVEMTQSLDS
nr:PREDICTED: uncharacterized protein LOC109042297 [Bemisia tabaci]XP_018914503.1 PREDICTED: uncharacterized protein LOC109042297 [Bemisia tabaci]